jgi:hypothetical protein
MKPWRVRSAEQIACTGKNRKAYKILIETPQGKGHVEE